MIYEKVNIYKDKMIVFMMVMRKVKKLRIRQYLNLEFYEIIVLLK